MEKFKSFPMMWLCVSFYIAFFVITGVANAGQIELKFAIHTPPSAAPTRIVELWAQRVEKESGGRVKIRVYHSGSLVDIKDIFPSTQKGVCDIGFAPLKMDASRYPLNMLIELGLMGWPEGYAHTQIWTQLQQKFPEMLQEFRGVKVIWHYVTMPMILHFTKKEVRRPEDIKGLRVEAAGNIRDAIQLLGGVPVVTSPADWYVGLQRGVIDGICQNYTPLYSFKVHTLLKYHTEVPLSYLAQAIIMNEEKWSSLPKEVKILFEDLRPWIEQESIKISMEESEKVKAICHEAGHSFIGPNQEEMMLWINKIRPMHNIWIEQNEKRGFRAKAIFEEAKRLIEEHSQRSYRRK